MRLDHVAIVTDDIERLKKFYAELFGGCAQENWTDGSVEICFVEFDNGVKIEFQKKEKPFRITSDIENTFGLAHLAFQVSSIEELKRVTDELQKKGAVIRTGPTAYGDDFYESSFFDPDGNIVEIAVVDKFLQGRKEGMKSKNDSETGS